MKGQASIEYLIIFGASLALVSILAISLGEEEAMLRGKSDDMQMGLRCEAAARAIESSLSSGAQMRFDFVKEGVRYSIEGGRFHAAYKGKTIEIGGLFIYDQAEPV